MGIIRHPVLTLALIGLSFQGVDFTPHGHDAKAAPIDPAPIHGEVTIYRDRMGVPHIDGATSAAVMYGLGYSLAQDRLAQIELIRRTNQGRRAEILGASFVASDIEARDRQLSDAELMRMYHQVPAEHRAMMQAFVDGINLKVDEILSGPAELTPFEFNKWGIKPSLWKLTDFLGYVSKPHNKSYELENLAFLNAMVDRYGPVIGRQIFDDVVPINDPDTPTTIPLGEDLAPVQPMPQPVFYQPGPIQAALEAYRAPASKTGTAPSGASRCMVIGPAKTASGYPILMQATADGPESHLHGGGFDHAGFSLPGWGPPIMGRASKHGWLLTSGHADTHDMYAEQLKPDDPYQYWYKGIWKTMDHRTETILVKDAKPVVHETAATIHGPVLQWDMAHGVAYSERSAERGHELDNWVGIVEMARAKNFEDFQTKGVAKVAWNLGVCYGDAQGKIAFWEAGRLPIRTSNTDSRLPMPGTGDYEWVGFYRFAQHPHMINPAQGYFHTWNSKATTWMREGDDARIGATFRTYLGSKLAAQGQQVTLSDMREINRKIFNAFGARDRTQTSPEFFAHFIRRAVAKSTDSDVIEAADLILSFNGLFEDLDGDGKYDNPGAPLWHHWLEVAPALVFGPSMDDWWSKVDEGRYERYQTSLLYRALQGSAAGLPMQFDFFNGRDPDDVIIQSIRKTIDDLKPEFGSLPMKDWHQPVYWKYFDPSRKVADKPALPHDEASTRTFATLGLGPAMVKHHGGEGWVGMMDLNPDEPSIYTVIEAGGQSLFIDSTGKGNPHLTDQVMMHANNEFKEIELPMDAVKHSAESITRLQY